VGEYTERPIKTIDILSDDRLVIQIGDGGAVVSEETGLYEVPGNAAIVLVTKDLAIKHVSGQITVSEYDKVFEYALHIYSVIERNRDDSSEDTPN